MFAFQFFADALEISYEEGKTRWDQGLARLKRRGIDPPATTKVKPEGARQKTPQLAADDAAKALALVLQDPLKDFFEKEGKLAWLRSQIQNAGGDPATADAALADLHAERTQREADAQSLVLPGLQVSETQMALRTIREADEVLGSVLDYLRWLGLVDAKNEWNHWVREEFLNEPGEVIRYMEKVFPGQHTPTPFTNFAGYRLLTKLCLHKSKIAQELYDKALTCLGHVQVGDQRLHEVLDANAASSSGDARAFVLGTEEAERQESSRNTFREPQRWYSTTSVELRSLKRPRLERRVRSALTIDEERLDWRKDLKVSAENLPGVRAQFTTFLCVEIQKGKLSRATPVGVWAARPPVRFRELALMAVSSYLALIGRSLSGNVDNEEVQPGPAEETRIDASKGPAAEDSQPLSGEDGDDSAASVDDEGWQLLTVLEEPEEDDDILKVSEVMRVARVCRAVYLPFRSDLANQMLALKCAETQGAFSERRPEVANGIPITVHKYRKSRDWPLAWRAIQKTKHLYQKRVRECLQNLFEAAGHTPELSAEELAKRVAASLRTH